MDKEKLPIKFFAPREIDELRVEGIGNNEIPKWVLSDNELEQRSIKLLDALVNLEVLMNERKNKKSVVPFIFVAKMDKESTAKSKRKYITNLFQMENTNNVIGVKTSDSLLIKVANTNELDELSSRIKNFKLNCRSLSCLENFEPYTPFYAEVPKDYNAKVKLVNYQDYEQNIAIQRLLERTLHEREIIFKKTLYSAEHSIYKLQDINNAVIDDLKKYDIYEGIFSIEPMPKYIVGLDDVDYENDRISVIYPDDQMDYVKIGILDNGVAHIKYLSPWLCKEKWSPYPESAITPSHGTFVAGVVLYGDQCEQKELVGHGGIKLFDATVFPDTSKEGLDEDELIENIKEAIKRYHNEIKIWNLSISITRLIGDHKFSDMAIALDALQDQHNIMICKSAGNCNNFQLNLPKGRIHEGADSVRSLVVGSIAHEKGIYDYAEIDNPSPFSRIGPGPEYIIKPEISHYGGNAGIKPNGEVSITGVTSFSMNGALSKAAGTSYSTPRVAALAAGIYQNIAEEFDPLLLKALIIHSASYPSNLKVPEVERTKQIGFGIPKTVKDIIYNSPYEVTLILRDTLAKSEIIDIMDFPMPACLIKNGYFTGQIIATLVYDPILDPSQGIEYCQSNIDIKFGSYDEKFDRDISQRHILNPIGRKGSQNLLLGNFFSKNKMKNKSEEFAMKERLQIQYGDKYYPVKKYAIDLSELTDKKKIDYLTPDKKWFLYLKGIYRDHLEQKSIIDSFQLSQEFCLMLTIRDPLSKENVYDEVTQKLNEFNFWHSNIKIATDVNIHQN